MDLKSFWRRANWVSDLKKKETASSDGVFKDTVSSLGRDIRELISRVDILKKNLRSKDAYLYGKIIEKGGQEGKLYYSDEILRIREIIKSAICTRRTLEKIFYLLNNLEDKGIILSLFLSKVLIERIQTKILQIFPHFEREFASIARSIDCLFVIMKIKYPPGDKFSYNAEVESILDGIKNAVDVEMLERLPPIPIII